MFRCSPDTIDFVEHTIADFSDCEIEVGSVEDLVDDEATIQTAGR